MEKIPRPLLKNGEEVTSQWRHRDGSARIRVESELLEELGKTCRVWVEVNCLGRVRVETEEGRGGTGGLQVMNGAMRHENDQQQRGGGEESGT